MNDFKKLVLSLIFFVIVTTTIKTINADHVISTDIGNINLNKSEINLKIENYSPEQDNDDEGGAFKINDHYENHKNCGTRTVPFYPQRNPKIVGGVPAPYGAYPWQVELQMFQYEQKKFQHHCGGAVIGKHLVITAAHCIHQLPQPNLLRLVIGNHDLFKRDHYEHSFRVDRLLVHPDFRHNGPYSNDIALIKVHGNNAAGILFNSHVKPICLPTPDIILQPGNWCSVTGWGVQNSKDSNKGIARILRAAAVPVLDQITCRRSDIHSGTTAGSGAQGDKSRLQQQPILESMLCAGYLSGGVDACGGDSGGPLACEHENRFYLTGLVSWGDGCAKKNRPGVYTRVDSFLPWIQRAIKQLEDDRG